MVEEKPAKECLMEAKDFRTTVCRHPMLLEAVLKHMKMETMEYLSSPPAASTSTDPPKSK